MRDGVSKPALPMRDGEDGATASTPKGPARKKTRVTKKIPERIQRPSDKASSVRPSDGDANPGSAVRPTDGNPTTFRARSSTVQSSDGDLQDDASGADTLSQEDYQVSALARAASLRSTLASSTARPIRGHFCSESEWQRVKSQRPSTARNVATAGKTRRKHGARKRRRRERASQELSDRVGLLAARPKSRASASVAGQGGASTPSLPRSQSSEGSNGSSIDRADL